MFIPSNVSALKLLVKAPRFDRILAQQAIKKLGSDNILLKLLALRLFFVKSTKSILNSVLS
jgi:hypothetical protein